MRASQQLLWTTLLSCAHALDLSIFVHYPSHNSAVDICGLVLSVTTSLETDSKPVLLQPFGDNIYRADLNLDDRYLSAEPLLAVLGNTPKRSSSEQCEKLCPHLSPNQLAELGVRSRVPPMSHSNEVHLWPSLCQQDPSSADLRTYSAAIGQDMAFTVHLPASFSENFLPRPTDRLPAVLFKFNSEWFWDYRNQRDYEYLHNSMVVGEIKEFVLVEIEEKGVVWQNWSNQPIFDDQGPQDNCTSKCPEDLEFICQTWPHTRNLYAGGNHSWGGASLFFDELYDHVLPQILALMPRRLDEDDASLTVGTWGYCIGGLASWNALVSKPNRFNLAYLGSPAMDYNCAEPFKRLENLSWVGRPPTIYLDTGSMEDDMMRRQVRLLYEKLVLKGLVPGRDIFFSESQFGTHEEKMLWRRAQVAMKSLFAIPGPSQGPASDRVAVPQVFGLSAEPTSVQEARPQILTWSSVLIAVLCLAGAFVVGHWSGKVKARGREGYNWLAK
mmetsp:Transcript_102236/g.184406  ORF Transcript_102236/g.184406 Transcript_102236/m.184406 type:complete len:498 (-) Transcript_102236:156-1649(-)